jgi:hypothetical protein
MATPAARRRKSVGDVDLKPRVTRALSKLCDRDTQKVAYDELAELCGSVRDDQVPTLLVRPSTPPPPSDASELPLRH